MWHLFSGSQGFFHWLWLLTYKNVIAGLACCGPIGYKLYVTAGLDVICSYVGYYVYVACLEDERSAVNDGSGDVE